MDTCDYCGAVLATEDCISDCQCPECYDQREAEKDREFDEKVALGYGV